ncbi:MAG: DUF3857 domain-containing protein [Myxococcota bacterium]|nr:DUF3857 domain-containing protein [Myxococcota bacterium]
MNRIKSATLIIFLGLFSVSCSTLAPLQTWHKPSEIAKMTEPPSDISEAFDILAIEGNDINTARELIKSTPQDFALPTASRQAFISHLSLQHDECLKFTLRILENSPDTVDGLYFLQQLTRQYEDLLYEKDNLIRSLEKSLRKSKTPLIINYLTRLLYRIYDHEGDTEKAEETLERGGWLFQSRHIGPVAPYSYYGLEFSEMVTSTEALQNTKFAGRTRFVKQSDALQTEMVISRDSDAGIHLAESYFKLPLQSEKESLTLIIRSSQGYRIFVDNQEILRRAGESQSKPRLQMANLKLSGGWHRIRIASVAAGNSSVHVSLLKSNGEPLIEKHTFQPHPIPETSRPLAPREFSLLKQFDTLSLSQIVDTKYHLLLKSLISTNPFIHAPEVARSLLRPIQSKASESALFHYSLAKLSQTKNNSKGQQISHLETARRLSNNVPLYVLELVKRTVSNEPEKALNMIMSLEKSSKPSPQITLLKFAIYKLRGWLQFADKTYKQALGGWLAQDNILGALSYFRSRKDVETVRQLEERFINGSGSYAEDAKLRLKQYRGQPAELEPLLKRALASKASSRASYVDLARFYLSQSKPEEAIKVANDYLKKNPDSTEMMRVAISGLQILGDNDKLFKFINTHQDYLSSNLEFEILRASLENRVIGLPHRNSKLAKLLEVDPITIASEPLRKQWQKHGTVRLLDRHVDYVRANGHALSMTHFLTRLMTKEAADKAGEIPIQEGVVRLSLRTIKPSGLSIDAEHHRGKSDFSFASLAPGDTIEDQSVTISEPRSRDGGYQQIFYFQDSAPNLRSEFIVVTPNNMKLEYRSYNGAPKPKIIKEANETIYVWRRDNVPAQKPEPHSVHSREFTPFVVVSHGLTNQSARQQNAGLYYGAFRGSYDITLTAKKLISDDDSAQRKAEKIFSWILQEIKPGNEFSPAETLKNKEGNRFALFAVMLDAVGVKSEIALTRSDFTYQVEPQYPDTRYYNIPLLKIMDGKKTTWARISRRLSWLGKLQPDLQNSSYILASDPQAKPTRFTNTDIANWYSKSRIELSITATGQAIGALHITLPYGIGESLRQPLSVISEKNKAQVLTRWIGSIIQGFDAFDYEFSPPSDNPAQPVSLVIKIASRSLLQVAEGKVMLPRFFDNFIASEMIGTPSLSEYIKLSDRTVPLLFRGLKEDMTVVLKFKSKLGLPSRSPKSWTRKSKWGKFEQSFEWDQKANTATLRRVVDMPHTRISTSDYIEFLDLIHELRLRIRDQLVIDAVL